MPVPAICNQGVTSSNLVGGTIFPNFCSDIHRQHCRARRATGFSIR